VRLAVGFGIMRAVAAAVRERSGKDKAAAAFVAYVDRVEALVNLYGAADTAESLVCDLTAAYGIEADVLLADYLVQATFYACLPVWPQEFAVLFEARDQDRSRQGSSVVRDVTYRFRVNGRNPQDGKSAYLARVDRLRTVLGVPVDERTSGATKAD
jgi:hypothetical protein